MNKSYPNKRDCEHGSMRGKCDICEYERDIDYLEAWKKNASERMQSLSIYNYVKYIKEIEKRNNKLKMPMVISESRMDCFKAGAEPLAYSIGREDKQTGGEE